MGHMHQHQGLLLRRSLQGRLAGSMRRTLQRHTMLHCTFSCTFFDWYVVVGVHHASAAQGPCQCGSQKGKYLCQGTCNHAVDFMLVLLTVLRVAATNAGTGAHKAVLVAAQQTASASRQHSVGCSSSKGMGLDITQLRALKASESAS